MNYKLKGSFKNPKLAIRVRNTVLVISKMDSSRKGSRMVHKKVTVA